MLPAFHAARSSARKRLPDRRPSVTASIQWKDSPLAISLGFAVDGRPLRAFSATRAHRPNSDLDMTADDIAVLVSLLLQHGVGLHAIAHSLGRLPDGEPPSIVSAIIDEAMKLEVSP